MFFLQRGKFGSKLEEIDSKFSNLFGFNICLVLQHGFSKVCLHLTVT